MGVNSDTRRSELSVRLQSYRANHSSTHLVASFSLQRRHQSQRGMQKRDNMRGKTTKDTPVSTDSPYQTGSSSSDDDTAIRHSASRKSLDRVPISSRRESGIINAVTDTVKFYCTIVYFLFGGSYEKCPFFTESPQAKAQLYSLCLVLWMWQQPHYRCGSFQDDMLANLRNVAVPGTGIPLSLVVQSKILAVVFLLIVYPLIALVAGLRKGGWSVSCATRCYAEQLLCPQDWFSFWRLNCVLASCHALVNNPTGFAQEDKWTFLTDAKEADIPVSPWLDVENLVIKDKNEEGGMGIHFYTNATQGGDWIIQTKLSNNSFVSGLLPKKAPLSTLRVITSSRGGLRQGSTSGPSAPLEGNVQPSDVNALSCVFRAGREGALTDHSSILFDVDMRTGKILKGTTNMHWYQLGLDKIVSTDWICLDHTITEHPDTGVRVTGNTIPNIEGIKKLCEDAHLKLLPDVPLAGWDVALTEEAGMCLLEVNLSCNFFRGTFDQNAYFAFVTDWFSFLDKASRK